MNGLQFNYFKKEKDTINLPPIDNNKGYFGRFIPAMNMWYKACAFVKGEEGEGASFGASHVDDVFEEANKSIFFIFTY